MSTAQSTPTEGCAEVTGPLIVDAVDDGLKTRRNSWAEPLVGASLTSPHCVVDADISVIW